MDLAQQLALWADQLRDMSASGLRFCKDPYDLEHYRRIQELAMAMYARATATPPDVLEPLRAPIFTRLTPFAVGDAAVIDDAGRILLIRRADNGLWAMPGGALEVGETPAEGVLREAFEETGVRCQVVALVGVFDSRYCGTPSRHHLYQFVFLCRPRADCPPQAPVYPQEVLGVEWFAADALPELDPGHRSRIPEAFRLWRGDPAPFFDLPEAAAHVEGVAPCSD